MRSINTDGGEPEFGFAAARLLHELSEWVAGVADFADRVTDFGIGADEHGGELAVVGRVAQPTEQFGFAAGLSLDQSALRGVLNVEFTNQVLHDNDRRVSVADAKAQTRLAVRQEADNGPRFLTGAAPNFT